MPDQKFGPLLSFYDVESALRDHLKTWLSAWLAARERAKSIVPGTIARPRSWLIKNNFSALPGEDRTPAVIIVSPGDDEIPDVHGEGKINAKLEMAIAVMCHGRDSDAARELAGHYQAAIIGILVKNKNFGIGFVEHYAGSAMEDLDDDLNRTICVVRIACSVVVQNFANFIDGPKIVPGDPFEFLEDSPLVETIDISVQTGLIPGNIANVATKYDINITGGKT